MTGARLFPVEATRAELAAERRQQFDGRPCPACGGVDDGCTCHRTGAEALDIFQALEADQ